jgi:formylglycine-generating enzyme required for sulfatase activity
MCAGLLAHYYHMQHIRDLHDVTVGIFHHRTEGNEKFLKNLKALQKTVSTFEHETFPKISDSTQIDDRICIFLDPVKGMTLSKYFETHAVPGERGLAVKETTRMIALLLGAIGYAHFQGLDHRDLDTDLIYVQEDGSIRILGLGVKAAMGVDLFESIVSASVSPLVCSKSLVRLNSFEIMSPEYKSGIAEDSRVDVYAVGFIGYWLLLGRKAVLSKYEPPSILMPELEPSWDVYFENSFERSKDKRYQSCKMALLGLKKTDAECLSEGSGLVQLQIDRIPVPKKIVERGMLAARIYRLFLIGLLGVSLIAVAACFLDFSFSGSDPEPEVIRARAHVAGAEESAALAIRVDPPHFEVEIVGSSERFTAENGSLRLVAVPGDYKLRFTAPHHLEQILAVHVPEEPTAAERLDLELEPAWADVTIRTEPGAEVAVIDEQGAETVLGFADESGTFILEKSILAGTVQVHVSKAGYQSNTIADQAIKLGAVSEIDLPIQPLPASLSLQSQPPGASIVINDIELGQTPLQLHDFVPGEQYQVVAHLAGRRSVSRRIDVKPGADLTIDFGQLVPLSGEIDLEVEVLGPEAPDPAQLYPDLTVYVDETAYPFGSSALNQVPEGLHRIRLDHPQYVSAETQLEVEDRGRYLLQFDLQPRPSILQIEFPGHLDCELRLDGEIVSLNDGQALLPPNRELELELRIRNHLSMLRTFKLAPCETFVWQVSPVAIPGPSEGQRWMLPYLAIPFNWVPAGQFQMGSPLQEHARVPNEGPTTPVRFSYGFWAGVYEVTQAQYYEVTGQNPSKFKAPAHPVEFITWQEARDFCRLLTDLEREAGRLPVGYVYRLPSEAEWEYAARAGTRTPFYFGEEADASFGNFRGVYPRTRQDGLRAPEGYGTANVGHYQPNAFGLYDIHGNVREWTLDRYNGRHPGRSLADPQPRAEGDRIAVRGGGWEDSAARVRSAVREGVSPDVASNAIGFRVVLAPEL